MTDEQTAIKATYFSLIGNSLLAVIKFLAGLFRKFICTDCRCDRIDLPIFFHHFLVLFGIRYSNKPADENHPYGHGRAEPLDHVSWSWVF